MCIVESRKTAIFHCAVMRNNILFSLWVSHISHFLTSNFTSLSRSSSLSHSSFPPSTFSFSSSMWVSDDPLWSQCNQSVAYSVCVAGCCLGCTNCAGMVAQITFPAFVSHWNCQTETFSCLHSFSFSPIPPHAQPWCMHPPFRCFNSKRSRVSVCCIGGGSCYGCETLLHMFVKMFPRQ